jgi:putative pyruvate formate lyase activating enzyme
MKSNNQSSRKKSVAFQSDIVIDENGDIFVSFLGADLLHLIENKETNTKKKSHPQPLTLPTIKELSNSAYKNCKVCPKSCGFDRISKSHPLCGDYKLRVSNYGISYGDEKILSEDGGSGIIFLSGCPLTCPSCINTEKVHSQGNETSPQEFYQLMYELREKNVANIQILSPTVHFPMLEQILIPLKDSGFDVPIAFKTSGYDKPDQIKRFEGLVDIYIPDLKPCFNLQWSKEAKVGVDYSNLFIESIDEMYQQVGTPQFDNNGSIIKGILIRYVKPTFLSSDQNHQIMTFLESFKDKAYISILDNYVTLESL